MEQSPVRHCLRKEGTILAKFQDIYKQYGKSVYRYLLSLSGSEDLAEELLQETFYQAFLHIDQFEGRSSLYTWLCQIGKNAWLKECRRRIRFTEHSWEDLTLSSNDLPPETLLLKKEEYHRVRQAVLNLPEPYQDVFILHIYGEVKLKDIAASYGKSESWAKVTFYRARQQILKEVSQ